MLARLPDGQRLCACIQLITHIARCHANPIQPDGDIASDAHRANANPALSNPFCYIHDGAKPNADHARIANTHADTRCGI